MTVPGTIDGPPPAGEVDHLGAGSVRLPGIIAQSVGAMGVTGIVALLVPLIAETAGSGGWLTWVIASLVMLMVAWCISRLATRIATTGGPYGLVCKALGQFWGVFVGWISLLLIGLFSAGTLVGFGIYGSQFLASVGVASGHAATDLCYLVGLVGSLLVAVSGMRRSAIVMLVMEAVALVVVLAVMAAVLVHHRVPIVDHTQLGLHHTSLGLVVDGIVLAVLSFGGFETATVLGREARNPLRAIPVSMLLTVSVAGLLWTFCGYVLVMGFEGAHVSIASAAAPLEELATIGGVGWLRDAVSLTISITLFGSLIAIFNGVSRLMFTMAREGLAPAPLLRINRRWGTPVVANVVLAVVWGVAIVVVVATDLAPFTALGDFGDVSGYGYMVIYAILAAGALRYLWRQHRLRPLDAAAAVISVGIMTYVFYENAFLPTPDGWIFYAVLGTMVGMVALYAALRVIRPSVFDRVGTSVDDDTAVEATPGRAEAAA
jgi:amino acid transporter